LKNEKEDVFGTQHIDSSVTERYWHSGKIS